jgi:hypothetical protein
MKSAIGGSQPAPGGRFALGSLFDFIPVSRSIGDLPDVRAATAGDQGTGS